MRRPSGISLPTILAFFSIFCAPGGSIRYGSLRSQHNLSCSRLFHDAAYAHSQAERGMSDIVIDDYDFFPNPGHISSCAEIRERHSLPSTPKPHSFGESIFPIAFTSVVYRDFYQLERLFAFFYQPQNVFCYAIDSKSDGVFKRRMRQLAACFPNNVYLAEGDELNVHNSGHGMSRAYLECMKTLRLKQWRYMVLLQNHDVPIRTNRELVSIFRTFNGTNDVETGWPSNHEHSGDYSFAHLKFFNNRPSASGALHLTKGSSSASLSRAFVVDFLLGGGLNLEGFIDELEKGEYGVDEHFISTLNANDELAAPGGFTLQCLESKVQHATRFAIWVWAPNPCLSHRYRNAVCLPGIKDFAFIAQLPHLFFNKLSPQYDYVAYDCWMTAMEERSRRQRDTGGRKGSGYGFPSLNRHYYLSLPHVRWNREKWWCSSGSERKRFDCEHWEYKDEYEY